jgi:hypothetical protein
LIQKSNIYTILDAIKDKITNEVKKIFYKYLEREKLVDFTLSINNKSIFSNFSKKEELPSTKNSFAQQLSFETIRKYQ